METTEETTYHLRVAFDYQAMVSLTEWGPVERRYHNLREWDGTVESLYRYTQTYGHRPPTEAVFGHRFEGVYGYRWTDKAVEVLRTVTLKDISTIEEYN